ncbi:uncharacterized protein PITG_06091 [Phytophthora infestans T30-4]|uniref:Uncharacterized protein n=1 Tax=Phytophthora infestans (strain T30-4) TaxID=403677 RepID=D0N6D6_PHYIT|nr:uncharacterized protein PITG_06091 [Phytophthora infestans T30-4]EEY70627.1 conserved hypothetical protein [Phytophthora infestans T30-4]|eukprot:XP_002998281.1 conserved hypothetical protein [Phytophthora infestans T30-4]
MRRHRSCWSLTRLISQANETAKDLNTTLSSPPKINPGLDRLMSLSSVVSEDAIELGPPPSGPPALTIGNSLMGGGIELQPAATNVNTYNFDWKLHRSASSSGGHGATKGASRGLRAQLERTLAASQKGTN